MLSHIRAGGGPVDATSELGRDAFLPGDPVGVRVDEARQLAGHGRVGEAGETKHRIVTTGVDRHHGHFRIGHELRPDARLVARPHLPVRGSSVTDGVDALLPVLKLELLLLFGEQARVDARILDEFAARHDALEPCLEQ